MKICFLDNTTFQYNSKDLYSNKLRGAESVLINISKALNKLNHQITIINNCPSTQMINGIKWININSKIKAENYDLVISNGDCRLFKFAISKRNILFSHSVQNIEKFIRKKQLFAFLKYKPKICFLSKYHQVSRSKILYPFGSINLKWSVDDIFAETKISANVNKNQAIFTSDKDRNLDLLIDIWKNLIFTKNQKLKLLVNDRDANSEKTGIFTRIKGDQQKLIEDLKNSRLYLIPGHKAELFCLAAEEAKELCIPIVTLGIGCLAERVEHGKSGFIAKNKDEFANFALELFNNDPLWFQMRNFLLENRGKNNWIKVAKNLIEQI